MRMQQKGLLSLVEGGYAIRNTQICTHGSGVLSLMKHDGRLETHSDRSLSCIKAVLGRQ